MEPNRKILVSFYRAIIPMGKFNMKTHRSAFEASLHKANQILKVSGLQISDAETNQSVMERLKNRKYFCFFNIWLYFGVLGEFAWFIQKGIVENAFIEATYTLPCATLSILGSCKIYYRLKYGHIINDLIYRLRKLQAGKYDSDIHTDPIANEAVLKMVRNLDLSIKAQTFFYACGIIAFGAGPLIIMGFTYHATGELTLRFPLLILYPFDPTDLRVYPFVYVHQMTAAVFAVWTIFGPDCLYYVFCTFTQVHFCLLQYDMEKIINPSLNLRLADNITTYRKKFTACVTRHWELIGLTNLIEVVYSKSALFNFIASSLLLCLAGFNIVAYKDLAMLGNFLSFLVMFLLQIYLICYYGDNVSQSSVALSNAVYNSQWYNADAKTAKEMLLILTRAQKPCKLTAFTFIDINLTAFTRVIVVFVVVVIVVVFTVWGRRTRTLGHLMTLSHSWSYFALLQTVYKKDAEIN